MPHPATIYALASAPGKAGVAVVRISGAAAREALVSLGVTKPLKPRHATLVTLKKPNIEKEGVATHSVAPSPSWEGGLEIDPDTHSTPPHLTSPAREEGLPSQPQAHAPPTIDTALALYFPAPHSFTGEDVVELHLHGGRAVVKMLLDALNAHPGLRLAEPGEFTRRAFMNGKMDLLQAEALSDLIDAETPAQHAQALRQMGEAGRRIEALRDAILTPLALLEAYIDFPDEDIPESVLEEVTGRIEKLIKEVEDLLDDGGIGEKIREGLRIVIFGPPNAGKSSLMNAIARRDVAIVSPEAGTTRDLIEIQLEIGGFAATLTDTAGIREAEGMVEAEGVRRAVERIANADLKLAVFDSVTMSEQFSEFASLIDETTLIIANKSDLLSNSPLAGESSASVGGATEPSMCKDDHQKGLYETSSRSFCAQGGSVAALHDRLSTETTTKLAIETSFDPPLPLSTRTGEGMDTLLTLLKETIAHRMESGAPSPLITRARHREAFADALTSLKVFSAHAPIELACEELRHACNAVAKITGKISTDDLLDVVFRRFCIGK